MSDVKASSSWALSLKRPLSPADYPFSEVKFLSRWEETALASSSVSARLPGQPLEGARQPQALRAGAGRRDFSLSGSESGGG